VLIFVAVASAISGVTQLLSWQNILPATAALSLIAGAWAVHTWTARARPAGAGRRRVARFSLPVRVLSLAAAVASLAGLASAAYVRFMPPPPLFAIDLVIDSSLDLPASGVNAVTAYVRQSGIRVAMRPVPIDARDTPGVITPAQVSDQFSGLELADTFPGVRVRPRHRAPPLV